MPTGGWSAKSNTRTTILLGCAIIWKATLSPCSTGRDVRLGVPDAEVLPAVRRRLADLAFHGVVVAALAAATDPGMVGVQPAQVCPVVRYKLVPALEEMRELLLA